MASKAKKTYKQSKIAFRDSQKFLVGGVNSPVRAFTAVGGNPIFFEKGKGAHISDIDGETFIDYVGSWGPMILGHNCSSVRIMVEKTIKNGFGFGAPHRLETQLAKLINQAFPSIGLVRMVNSGTEATMSAIRLARGFTKRNKILKFAGGYHGHGDSFLIKAGSGALTLGLPNSPGVTDAVARDTLTAEYNDIETVKKKFQKFGKGIAAIIIEPVAGNMGLVPGEKKFLQGLKKICKQYGSLLIFDEVMTGFRLALGGAQELYGITPDLTCLGKIVGGGFPVAAYGGRKVIMEHLAPLGDVYQAGTLSGQPIGMAAGIATLEYLGKNQNLIYAHLEKNAKQIEKTVENLIIEHNYPISFNRVGSMFTIFFKSGGVKDFNESKKSDTSKYAKFFNHLLEEGVYFPPSQFESCFISYAHNQKTTKQTIEAITISLKKVFNK